jgi:hypothetical protein
MDGWIYGWMDGWIGGWMDEYMDGWMDRYIDGQRGKGLAASLLALEGQCCLGPGPFHS